MADDNSNGEDIEDLIHGDQGSGEDNASDPENEEGFKGEIFGYQESSEDCAGSPEYRDQDRPLDTPLLERLLSDKCNIALDNQHSPEPRSPQLLPSGPLVEALASPNTQVNGPSTADLAVLTNGRADHPFILDGPATRFGRK